MAPSAFWWKYILSASSLPLTASTPPVMSEWPPMNFVTDVMLMSAPSSSGLQNCAGHEEVAVRGKT